MKWIYRFDDFFWITVFTYFHYKSIIHIHVPYKLVGGFPNKYVGLSLHLPDKSVRLLTTVLVHMQLDCFHMIGYLLL